jgi:DNA-binding Lrp family transcriptional regulator
MINLVKGLSLNSMYINYNYKKLEYEIFVLSCVKAKYHKQSLESVALKIKEIEGVENVYVILGEMDFFVMIRAKDKDQLKNIVEKMIALPEIDHSSTYLIISSV